MKATGVVRGIDHLGRVVLPSPLRKILGISEKDGIEILLEGNQIVLKKYDLTCTFCHSTENTTMFKGKLICSRCLGEAVDVT